VYVLIVAVEHSRNGNGYMQKHPFLAMERYLPPETPDAAGNSFMREILVAKVVRRNLRRPQCNLMQNSSQQE
jgi:hypothetical protein